MFVSLSIAYCPVKNFFICYSMFYTKEEYVGCIVYPENSNIILVVPIVLHNIVAFLIGLLLSVFCL